MITRISSLQHPLIKHLVKLRQDRAYRTKEGSVLIAGKHLVKEIGSHSTVQALLIEEGLTVPPIKAEKTYIVSAAVMQKVTGLQSSEGIAAQVPLPMEHPLAGLSKIIALDRVSDPGNMGTLLRTALALGWQGAFVLDNSVDLFNEKALRASRGAPFRLPFRTGSYKDLETLIHNNHLQPFAADTHGTPLSDIASPSRPLLILGNEAQGIADELHSLCTSVTIPMPGAMESLNVAVAGGILMFVLLNTDHFTIV
jgi:TrmH family RNA methyltransferase